MSNPAAIAALIRYHRDRRKRKLVGKRKLYSQDAKRSELMSSGPARMDPLVNRGNGGYKHNGHWKYF